MPHARSFPPVLHALHQIDIDYADGDGIDFEPYQAFMPRAEVVDWFRAWTGNPDAECADYLIFGQDGTGGYAAIWPVRAGVDLLEQPIVFFGSEGQLGVVASNFSDYLWLLAGNHGPFEAVVLMDPDRPDNKEFLAFAQAHAIGSRKSVERIVATASAEFPDFERGIEAMCG